jgi:stage II sporulation protein AB (anti-sigma F factor)
MNIVNEMRLTVPSLSVNEGFVRAVVGAFATRLNPTLEQVSDIKTVVSEAVTNAIIHGYEGTVGEVEVYAAIHGRKLKLIITDHGKGIEDIEQAREPFYTSRPDLERSGMGFMVMEAFMDRVQVESAPGQGTRLTLEKEILPPLDPEPKK